MHSAPYYSEDPQSRIKGRLSGFRATYTTPTVIPVIERERLNTISALARTFIFENGGSSDMTVDGSSTPVEFEILREDDKQITLHTVGLFLESDNALDLNSKDRKQFGTAGLLTNGIEFEIFYGTPRGTFPIFVEPVKKLEDLLFYSIPGTFVNLLRATASAPDQVQMRVQLGTDLIFPHIGPDRLIVRINDNLTSLDSFKMVAFGYEELR